MLRNPSDVGYRKDIYKSIRTLFLFFDPKQMRVLELERLSGWAGVLFQHPFLSMLVSHGMSRQDSCPPSFRIVTKWILSTFNKTSQEKELFLNYVKRMEEIGGRSDIGLSVSLPSCCSSED